jgi:hypothetical protein
MVSHVRNRVVEARNNGRARSRWASQSRRCGRIHESQSRRSLQPAIWAKNLTAFL